MDDQIDGLIFEIIDDIKTLSYDDVINYVKFNLYKFYVMIEKYFDFHEKSVMFQEETMANVVNKRLGFEFTAIYKDYFMSDLNYEDYLLSTNVIFGLDLVDIYCRSNNDDDILKFLNIEFDSKFYRDRFLNYILSNVYTYLKLNGCNDDFDVNFVNLTEKIDKRMKCFYEDDEYVIKLVKKYVNIYRDVKWFEFKDIRDYIPFDKIDLIYKLDENYKHPSDVLKNATEVYTILEEVQKFLFDNIEKLTLQDKDDFEIVEWIKQLLNNEVVVYYSENTVFKADDDNYFKNLIRLFLLSSFYEYCNYNLDNVDYQDLALFKFIDDGINEEDALLLFDDSDDCDLIISKFVDYYFSKEKTELLARKKIIQDNRFDKVLKFNPYVYLDYRRAFGTLFPLETSKSTEYGNIILGSLFDIISLSDNLEDEYGIKFQDISQMFKNDFFDIHLDLDEITGFILINVYENLVNKADLDDLEKDFILSMECNEINLDDIYENDYLFGQLLVYFFNLNGEYLNDNKLKKLRNSVEINKIKILKKYDPFFEIDGEILK